VVTPVSDILGDGEGLCSFLSMRGAVSGVFTNDLDALVYGSKTLINEFKVT
jgi:hypothetical protein